MAQLLTQNRKQSQEGIEFIEEVFSVIQQDSGKLRTVDLDRIFGGRQQDVRTAIMKLTCAGRISRKRGLGASGIEYFYHDHASPSFAKFRQRTTRFYA
jgi:hypothetical protein